MAGSIILEGRQEFNTAINKIKTKTNAYVKKAITEMSQAVVESARREFTTVVESADGQRVLASGEKKLKGEKIVRKGNHVGGVQPHIRSGALARSIKADITNISVGRYMAEIGPHMVYGRRVELGFTGQDSLKRNYNQPGYPYLGPGFEKAMPEIREIYIRNMTEAFSV